MPIRTAITVTGLDELRADIRRIKDRGLADELKRVHREIAEDIVSKALPHVPVRTGRLRASVRAAGDLKGAVGRAGGSRVPYAAAIHWGSPKRGIPRRPFLQNAARQVERGLVDRYQDALERLLRTIHSRP